MPRRSPAKSEPFVRPARPGDLPALEAIREAAFGPFIAAIGRPPTPMLEPLGASIAEARALVAIADGEVAGYVTAQIALSTPSALVETLAVAPSHEGRGLGRLLMGAVEARAKAAGVQRITLYTNVVMIGAQRLYRALGYDEADAREEDGFSRIYFEKPLLPAAVAKPSVAGLFGRRRGQAGGTVRADDPLLLPSGDALAGELAAEVAAVGGPLRLEIGFGNGDHLLSHAAQAPVTVIGVEPFETGLARCLREISTRQLTNVRLYGGDARDILAALPAGSLERIDLLYPDPWPKQKHWKRRFLSMASLDLMAHALPPRGVLRFASDIDSYIRWTRDHIARHPAFTLEADTADPWPHWPSTRYEAKALREGRAPRYLTVRRTQEGR